MVTTVDELNKLIEDLEQQLTGFDAHIEALKDRRDSALKEYHDSKRQDTGAWDHYTAFHCEIMQTFEDRSSVREKLSRAKFDRVEAEREEFARPQQGLLGWLFRPLGPLPKDARNVHPPPEALADLPHYRLPALLLFVCVASMLISVALLMPWLVVSPMSIIAKVLVPLLGTGLGWTLTILVTFMLMSYFARGNKLPQYQGQLIDKAAMYEEQWFRMGAESWSFRQRATSCAMFGVVHVSNVFYPVTSLLVLMVAGAALMATYLREYKRSGSTERALLASAKMHAAYNRYAFAYMFVALGSLFIARMVL